jgi:hypothetical protein
LALKLLPVDDMSAWRMLLHVDHPAVAAAAFALVQLVWARVGFAQNPAPRASGDSAPAAASQAATDSREQGLLPEPRWLTRAMQRIAVRTDGPPSTKDGFYPAIGSTMAGAGWITVGPGYRDHITGPWLFATSAALSWHGYRTADIATSVDLPGGAVTVGAQALWQDQTQLIYYGSHASARLSDGSEYRLRASDYTASAAFHMPRDWSIQVRAGLMPQPDLLSPAGWHDRGFPDARRLFDDSSAPGIFAPPSMWHGDVAIAINRLNEPGHPTDGWFARAEAAAYRDRDYGRFLFNRYQADVVDVVPVTADTWTLLIRGSAVLTATPYGDLVPFYMEPALGGQNLLRGYLDYRFHDRNVLAAQIESRWAILAHVDGALFVDLGALAPHPNAFRGADLKTSYGAGVRIHTAKTTLVRIDVGRSPEGWRCLVQFRDPFRLPLFRRRAGVIPLLP